MFRMINQKVHLVICKVEAEIKCPSADLETIKTCYIKLKKKKTITYSPFRRSN